MEASNTQVGCRVPLLESHGFDWEHNIDNLDKQPHPRVMKSHFPPSTFQSRLDKVKVVVSIRNPKDTVTSLHHYYKMAKFVPCQVPYKNTFGAFMDDKSYGILNVFGNFFPWYMQLEPILSHKNVLLVKYEDCKKDLKATIKRIAIFLSKDLDEKVISDIAEYCSFENAKKNLMFNQTEQEIYHSDKGNFCRKGMVGAWKDEMTDEQSQIVDKMYKNTLKKIGIELQFE